MSTPEDIQLFLNTYKTMMSVGDVIIINSRPNNAQTLASLELTGKEQEKVLKQLEVKDYCSGPLDDDKGRPTKWWVFGKVIKSQEIYIKIGLGQFNRNPLCMSFHIAQSALNYPYNKQ